jgi:outer membrane lipoprotein SlyB
VSYKKKKDMKKVLIIALGAVMLMSSCHTSNTAAGAYTGAQFGHVIGSAIGGITGGWRGHDVGSLIGTVGGMAAGAVIGNAIDKAEAKKYEKRQEETYQRHRMQRHQDSGYDPEGRGDDRITFSNDPSSDLEIRHAGIFEKQRDGVLTRGEECSVVFEIFNTSDRTIYDVRPLVEDVTGNKHVNISPNLRIESIAPHKGIRYTATILADKKLKDGEILVRVGVAQGDQELTSQTREFTVPTAKEAR